MNISADTQGRVTGLAVNEGDRVSRASSSCRSIRATCGRGSQREASLGAASQAEQCACALESPARPSTGAGKLQRQQELWKGGLTTRETLDRTENEYDAQGPALPGAERADAAARMQQERATLESARYDLSKVRIESPINGIVTRRNIEEGETVVVGTMNNAGTVLLTIADMSVIEAEVEVDETDIPSVKIGQKAKITIDAIPGKTFTGKVTEIGNSPIQATAGQPGTQATNFKVVVTLDGEIPRGPAGLHVHRRDHDGDARQVVAVPIQALAVREIVLDDKGQIVRPPRARTTGAPRRAGGASSAEELPGQTRKETKGVFVVRDGKSRIRAGEDGYRRRQVLRGAVRPEGRRQGHHRTVQLGPGSEGRRRSRQGRAAPRDTGASRVDELLARCGGDRAASIWANKLRSFMTVLGNIVAVTSIIAVVSLIRGMDTYVTDAILTEVGADTFTVQRMASSRQSRGRTRPRTIPASRWRCGGGPRCIDHVDAVMAQSTARVVYRETVDSVQIRGVSREYS